MSWLGQFRRTSLSIRISISVGGAIVLGIIFLAIFADYLGLYNPFELSDESIVPPTTKHLMGTDSIGRDIFSRIVYGARISISVSFISVLMSASVGSLLGTLCGYAGGKIDMVVSMLSDTLYSFSALLMALIVSVLLGTGIVKTSFAVGVSFIPLYYRVVRSVTISVKEELFVEQTRALGASPFYIVLRHILPRCMSSIVVLMSLGMCRASLAVAGLGFLGFGIQQPTPEWGTDLNMGRRLFLSRAWWPVFFPGVMIMLLALGFNFLGEALNEMVNPKYRVR